jgi:hypothetical protein
MFASERVRASLRIMIFAGAVLMSGSALYAQATQPGIEAQTAALQMPVATRPARGMFENLSLFVGPDGSKQPQDLGINANMGIRVGANMGFPVVERLKLGAQIGVGVNASDAAVNVLDQITTVTHRTQTFITAGFFERPTERLSMGIGYDLLLERYYDDFRLQQWRGQVAYGVTSNDEVGGWFTKSARGQNGSMAGTPVRLDPISQIDGFTRHTWANLAQTTVWAGIASQHNDVVWVFPANPVDKNVLVYGAELSIPLSDKFAITGAANLLTPAATGTVDAFLGVSYFPGRSAFRSVRNTYAPIMGVANNPTFAVDLAR